MLPVYLPFPDRLMLPTPHNTVNRAPNRASPIVCNLQYVSIEHPLLGHNSSFKEGYKSGG